MKTYCVKFLMVAALLAVVAANLSTTVHASIGGTQSVSLTVPNGVTCGFTCTNDIDHGLSFIPGLYGENEWVWGGFCNGDIVTVSTTNCSVVATIVVSGELYGATDTATCSSDAKTVTFTLSHSQSITWDPVAECYVGNIDVGVSKSGETWCEAPPVEEY